MIIHIITRWLFFLLFISCSNTLWSQWSRTFDFQVGNEYAKRILLLEDGVLVWVKALCNGNTSVCEGLMKVDLDGNLLWKKVAFSDSLQTNHFQAMDRRNDTIFVNVNYLNNPLFYAILAFDLEGNYLGRHDYDVPNGIDGTHWARDISTGNDRLFVTCEYRDQATNRPRNRLLAFDQHWQKLWEDEPQPNASGGGVFWSNIVATPDGGAALIHSDCFSGKCAARVKKYGADGAVEWTAQPAGTSRAGGKLVYLNRYPLDGGYLGMWTIDSFGFFYPNPSILFKMDSTGQIEWQKLTITQLQNDFYQIFPTANGDIIACGMDANLTTLNTDSNYYYAGYVHRLNALGETLWERRIWDLSKGHAFGWFYDGLELDDGSLVFCGEMHDTLPDDPYPGNVWVVRLDSLGCLSPGCGTNQFLVSTEEAVPARTEEIFAAFPIPFDDQLNLVSILGRSIPAGAYRVALYNTQGQLMLERAFDPQLLTTLETGSFPLGNYVLTILRQGLPVQAMAVMKRF